ncbi:MAG: hypothetical protein WBQ24_00255 [Xanthobacteraceae bacterium]
MPATAALKTAPQFEGEPQPKETPQLRAAPRPARLFHARMLVTRAEEWCVEAGTPEEARALLASGAGHRSTPGESVHIELESLLED